MTRISGRKNAREENHERAESDTYATFSWITGQKGVNRVRVYRKKPGGPISIDWAPGGDRRRQNLEELVDEMVFSRSLAQKIAMKLSAGMLSKTEEAIGKRVLGISDSHSVADLLKHLHEAKEKVWSKSTKADSDRFRGFWESRLGRKDLRHVTPHMVNKIVHDEAAREERDERGALVMKRGKPVKKAWSARTQQAYLRYIVDAFYYAQRDLKWISEEHNLSAVKFPKVPKGTGEEYTEEELAVLIPATLHPTIDPRCAAVSAVIDCTGRRLNSVRQLRVNDFRVEMVRTVDGEEFEVGLIRFRPEYSKDGEGGEVPVTDWTRQRLEELVHRPAVRATGLFFVSGDLDDPSPTTTYFGRWHGKPRHPVSINKLNRWLRAAEKLAGVESKRGRAFHGLKRSLVTLGMDLLPREQIAELTGTTPQTLAAIYRKATLRSKATARVRLDEARRVLRLRTPPSP